MIKGEMSIEVPTLSQIEEMTKDTYLLLDELHKAVSFSSINFKNLFESKKKPFEDALSFREPIFYAGESAYSFQYREFSPIKYSSDNNWLVTNKGFTTLDVSNVIDSINEVQKEKWNTAMSSLSQVGPKDWPYLEIFKFSIDEILEKTEISKQVLRNVLEAFKTPTPSCNNDFSSISDFNIVNALPLIPFPDGEYLLFQIFNLFESYYESPFYWMGKDKNYIDKAVEYRGNFTEEIAFKSLSKVFGKENVFKNIEILDSSKNNLGEIDVLVVFGGRAIILQAKSKKLTIEARKGNDEAFRNDFEKSVQDAYDQGYKCAKLLEDKKFSFIDRNGDLLNIDRSYSEIYIFTVVSDHYPALSFQAFQFLNYQKEINIHAPFVIDVFILDVICELLSSPLYFLSYINRRVNYHNKILPNDELAILGYHLKRNLWIDEDISMMHFEDDLSHDIDIAMSARRDSTKGETLPKGILTKYKNSNFDNLVKEIESSKQKELVDFGFFLLKLDGDTIEKINDGIDIITGLTRKDRKVHDFTLAVADSGITVHCNVEDFQTATRRLQLHCKLRKYTTKAHYWFGICLEPQKGSIRFGINLEYDWEHSDTMDKMVGSFSSGTTDIDLNKMFSPKKRIGRNNPCYCGSGSGKKYKYCCLNK